MTIRSKGGLILPARRKLGGGGADDFNRANGTLTGSALLTGQTWVLPTGLTAVGIVSNKVSASVNGSGCMAVIDSGSFDHEVTCYVTKGSNYSGGPAVRCLATSSACIWMRPHQSAGYWQLIEGAGSYPTLATGGPAVTGTTYKATLRAIGRVIVGYVDDVPVLAGVSTLNLATGSRVGIWVEDSTAAIDNWSYAALDSYGNAA